MSPENFNNPTAEEVKNIPEKKAELDMEAVEHNEAKHQFQIDVDGYTGLLMYHQKEGKINLKHTRVPQEISGRGIAGLIIKSALEYSKNQGLKVVPTCPFVRRYISKHQEYLPLLDEVAKEMMTVYLE